MNVLLAALVLNFALFKFFLVLEFKQGLPLLHFGDFRVVFSFALVLEGFALASNFQHFLGLEFSLPLGFVSFKLTAVLEQLQLMLSPFFLFIKTPSRLP